MTKVLLVSTFEGGFQPITVASAVTPLKGAGFEVSVLDTYVDGIREELFLDPDMVAIAMPLFDAVLPGIEIAKRVRAVNPKAHITFFGQHATIHAARLSGVYGDSCISGEWEQPLVALASKLAGEHGPDHPGVIRPELLTVDAALRPFMPRNHFQVPTRDLLPPLHKYPQPQIERLLGGKQVVGSTEIARGCHHKCLYCSVFAAYDGKVLMVPEENVVADVRCLVAGGMTHLTFIDADFLNSKHHGIKVLRRLHEEFPYLTYDITTRVDHILENQETIREMGELGVRIITSALEFPKQEVLDILVKEISLADIDEAIAFLRTTSMKLNPTFIMYNPWVTLEDLATFSAFVERNQLADDIDPVQYETRLSLYKGSPLLALPQVQALELTEEEFRVEWKHPDPRVDQLFEESVTPPVDGVFKRCCLKC